MDLTRFDIRNKSQSPATRLETKKNTKPIIQRSRDLTHPLWCAPPNQTPIKNRLARPSPTDRSSMRQSESTVIALRQSNIPNGFRSLWTQDLYLPSTTLPRRPTSSTARYNLSPCQQTKGKQWKRMGILNVRVGNPHQNNYNVCYRSRYDPLTIPMRSL